MPPLTPMDGVLPAAKFWQAWHTHLGFGQLRLVPDPPQLGYVPSEGWVCAKHAWVCAKLALASAKRTWLFFCSAWVCAQTSLKHHRYYVHGTLEMNIHQVQRIKGELALYVFLSSPQII